MHSHNAREKMFTKHKEKWTGKSKYDRNMLNMHKFSQQFFEGLNISQPRVSELFCFLLFWYSSISSLLGQMSTKIKHNTPNHHHKNQKPIAMLKENPTRYRLFESEACREVSC